MNTKSNIYTRDSATRENTTFGVHPGSATRENTFGVHSVK